LDEKELSRFEKKQRQMENKIRKLEEENLKTKSWKFSGESGASSRPINSLLEEELDYEYASKLPPVITEEVTKKLEDIIRYRIQENAFDDVIKRTDLPEEKKIREEITLDSNKSKKSLAEIYEEEYKNTTKPDKTEEEQGAAPKYDKTQLSALRQFKLVFRELDDLIGSKNPIEKNQ